MVKERASDLAPAPEVVSATEKQMPSARMPAVAPELVPVASSASALVLVLVPMTARVAPEREQALVIV